MPSVDRRLYDAAVQRTSASGSRLLVPVKSFAQAKGRLADVLSPDQRSALMQWMCARVVAAAGDMPVHEVCDDRTVATWAESCGASVLWSPEQGLDAAVRRGVAELARLGADSVVVSHGDLPLAHRFDRLVVDGTVTIVPDRRGDGSNVIVVPADADFAFAYGRRSFERHVSRAVEAGLPLIVRRDPLLALDVDTPDDLFHPLIQEALPAWLRTNPANPHRKPD